MRCVKEENGNVQDLPSQVYGEVGMDTADLSEHTVLAPTNPYSASKAAAEMYITAYVSSFQLPAIIIRLNNVYGPHQVSVARRSKPRLEANDLPVPREFVADSDQAHRMPY